MVKEFDLRELNKVIENPLYNEISIHGGKVYGKTKKCIEKLEYVDLSKEKLEEIYNYIMKKAHVPLSERENPIHNLKIGNKFAYNILTPLVSKNNSYDFDIMINRNLIISLNANDYKPKKEGMSDKYSWNLYKVLRHIESGINNHSEYKILYKQDNISEGVDFKKSLHLDKIYIVEEFDGSLIGWRLNDVVGYHKKGIPQKFCFDLILSKNNTINITQEFLFNYKLYGRCFYDREHIMWWEGRDGRFTKINEHSKKCNWCGKHFTRTIKKRTIIERVEVWE